jgi:hypothetical protein
VLARPLAAGELGLDEPRADGVGPDALRAVLDGRRLREPS